MAFFYTFGILGQFSDFCLSFGGFKYLSSFFKKKIIFILFSTFSFSPFISLVTTTPNSHPPYAGSNMLFKKHAVHLFHFKVEFIFFHKPIFNC